MATSSVAEEMLALAPWQQRQCLLCASCLRPPRDVFERVVSASHARRWRAGSGDAQPPQQG